MKKPLLLTFDADRCEVIVGDRPVMLTVNEFEVFRAIAGSHAVLSRERLLADVWGGSSLTARAVDTCVSRLRRKLRAPLIITVRHRGYKFPIHDVQVSYAHRKAPASRKASRGLRQPAVGLR